MGRGGVSMKQREIYRAMQHCWPEKSKTRSAPESRMQIPSSWLQEWRAAKRAMLTEKLLAILLFVLIALALLFAIIEQAQAETYVVQTQTGELNVRANPWVGAEIVGRLGRGDTVEVKSITDGWAFVLLPNETGEGGYASMEYLALQGMPYDEIQWTVEEDPT